MESILSAHQPAYFPWLGYFHKIALSDVFVILDSVQFEKNSFINRNKIKTPQGSIWLTVPLLLKGHTQKSMMDMEINNDVNWRKKHWKSIYLNYKKAPYFSKYSDFFEETYKKKWDKLCLLLDHMLKFFIKELKIRTDIYKQSNLQIYSKKQKLILDMCKFFNPTLYVSGILGKNYIDISAFGNKGIRIIFQDYKHPVYPQLWGEFISHLSILDLLFNVGAEKASEIIRNRNIAKEDLRKYHAYRSS